MPTTDVARNGQAREIPKQTIIWRTQGALATRQRKAPFRALARMVAEAYFESRKKLGFPLASEPLRKEFLEK